MGFAVLLDLGAASATAQMWCCIRPSSWLCGYRSGDKVFITSRTATGVHKVAADMREEVRTSPCSSCLVSEKEIQPVHQATVTSN